MSEDAQDLGGMVLAQVVITRVMREDDIVDHVIAHDGDGDELGLAEALGMMRLAEDTLIQSRQHDGATMPEQIEPRTPNTVDCPTEPHEHRWRKRRPELTVGHDLGVQYHAAADGSVVVSEEVLSQLLRLAGFVPGEPPTGAPPVIPVGHGGYLGDQAVRRRVAEHGLIGLDLDEGPADV